VGAAATAVALLLGLVLWSPWNGDGGDASPLPSGSSASEDPAQVAAVTLKTAAANLERAGAVSYKGGFRDSAQKMTDFTFQTAPGDWSRGSLRDAGHTVRLLAADGNRMVRADRSYWSDKDYAEPLVKRFAGHWVDADAELPEVRALATSLAATNVAGRMRNAAARGRVTAGAPTTVDGVSARRFSTAAGHYYITTAKPYRLVRIASATSPGRSAPPVLPEGIDATVTRLSDGADDAFQASLARELGQLSGAVDPSVAFSTVGRSSFSPCGNTSCTAGFRIKNTVYDSLRSIDSANDDTPVEAVISVDITLDGHKVKHCSFTRRMAAEGTVAVGCKATYRSSAYRAHTVRGLPDAWARAVPDTELKKLKADFAEANPPGTTPAPSAP
jgi:hypothetical protein